MGTKLSQVLLEKGFFSALGTMEKAGPQPQQLWVRKGRPFTWDYNNGVCVVYDEDGRPWITQGCALTRESELEYKLTRGAHVPHSNDDGFFVREVLPKL